jgi:hypothetical protein
MAGNNIMIKIKALIIQALTDHFPNSSIGVQNIQIKRKKENACGQP